MKKLLIIFIIIALLLAILTAAAGYYLFFIPNLNEQNKTPYSFTIYKNISKEDFVKRATAEHLLVKNSTFEIAAYLLKFENARSGQYTLTKGMSNLQLIRLLRKGQHYPVTFTFNNIRTQQQLVEKIGNKFLFSPESLDSLLQDTVYMQQYGVNKANILTLFIPNTYQLYYDISSDDFIKKMYEQYQQFWTPQRTQKAQEIGLSAQEVMTLASIVEEENFKNTEKAIIAGLYINRLQKGMLLQADPTVKYAAGDFSLKRVLNVHTQVDSPYNTYKYKGLPPGPIRIPDMSSIDSVLNYRHHDYLYMCAKEDFSGAHNFAVTHAEHERNAKRYHEAVRRIK